MNSKANLIFLIGYLYNKNGMATWCIEAAQSLHRAGYQVLIAVAPGLESMVPCGIQVLTVQAFRPSRRTSIGKILYNVAFCLRYFWPVPGGIDAAKIILNEVARKNIPINIILWNQTNLLIPGHTIPQWVVGWAYPATLRGYLNKLSTTSTSNYFSRLHEQLYWYRTDNWAYCRASGVLAATRALTRELQKCHINVIHCAPGKSSIIPVLFNKVGPTTLLICARWLDEPRKRVLWMATMLSSIPNVHNNPIHFIGEATDYFLNRLKALLPHATFHGVLDRDCLTKQMQAADILLFGSILDDWGYVQVEAMSVGLTVFAPNQLPSTEIIPDRAYLFEPGNQLDFKAKLIPLLENPLLVREDKINFYRAYQRYFSGQVFEKSLVSAVQIKSTSECL